uniref:Fibrinogen C domain containing 1 n=1 Tax=Sinocyclocheilus rhinocerous TaxID=307959 RepID=A0A673I7S8_9TELE
IRESRARNTPISLSFCSYLLCTILLFVAVLLAVTVTGTILLMNHYQAPHMSDGPPHISTNQDEANALVTVERGDGSRINIFIDPNCPDYNSNFLRLEGVQTSLLHSLTDHDTDLKSVKGQDRALLVNLAEEVAKLSAHAGQLKMDYESLRRGQSNLGQDLNTLQTEQSRLIQVMAYRCTHMQNSCIFRGTYIQFRRPWGNRGLGEPWRRRELRGPGHGTRPGLHGRTPTTPHQKKILGENIIFRGPAYVIQRREDGSVNFFREWDSYREGFGKITGEYWLGLKQIHALSIQGNYELRIDLEDFENSTAFAQYGVFGVGLFSVDPEDDGYPLTIADYTGTAGDSLLKHNGMKFTTKDRDNDHSENNCASFYHGAWWYRNCHTSNLNGQYLRGQHTSYADGIEWSSWTGWQYSLKFTEMKIRPTREERESK